MEDNCSELLLANVVDNSPYMLGGEQISMKEAMGLYAESYINLILLSSIILFSYVLYTNFVIGTRFDLLAKWNIDVHELAILPAVMLIGVSIAYYIQ